MSGGNFNDIYEKAGVEIFNPKDVAGGGVQDPTGEAGAPSGDAGGETQNPADVDFTTKFIEELNTKAGTKYGGIDDVINLINSEKTLRGSVDQMKSQMQNYKNPLEGNELLGKIYQFTTETNLGLNEFNMLNGANIDEMDPIDAIVASKLIENPGLASKKDILKASIVRGFNLDDEDIDDDEMEIRKMSAEIQGSDAKKKLLELQSKISVPDFSKAEDPVEVKKLQKQNLEAWKAILPDVVSNLDKIDIFDSLEDQKAGKDPLFSHEINDEVRADYVGRFNQYIQQTGIQPSEEVKSQLLDMAKNDYILTNWQSIARAYADSRADKIENEWLAKTGKDTRQLGRTEIPSTDGLNKVQQFNKKETDGILSKMGIKRK